MASLLANAQNSNIFKGGSGDGHNLRGYTQNSASIWKGGSADGHSMAGYTQNSASFWRGGQGDGYALNSYTQKVANIWMGGQGDGYTTNGYTQNSFNFWKGGAGDGYADSGYIQASTNFWKGGGGDGWASTYIPYTLLPVSMLSFDAEKYNTRFSRLSWKTGTEINTAYFEVERSADAINFAKVGIVKAAGNFTSSKTYTLIDSTPAKGYNYYRLKQVDINGKFVYSPARLVRFDVVKTIVRIYPTPAKNWINIELPENNRSENTVINIIDMKGVVVNHIRVPANSNSLVRIPVDMLPRAAYMVHIVSATATNSTTIILQ